MNTELREKFITYAFPDKACDVESVDLMLSFFAPIDFDDEQESGVKQVKIRRDDEGRVTIAKSRKLPNMRLNLKDASLAGICGGVVSVAANTVFSMDNEILIPFLCLNFLKFAQDLSIIEISPRDAEILVKLFEKGLRGVGTEELAEELKGIVKPENLEARLAKLEKLGCVKVLRGKVWLNETVVIERE